MADYYIAFDEESFGHYHSPENFNFHLSPESALEEAQGDFPDAETIYVFCVTIDLDKTYTKTWTES